MQGGRRRKRAAGEEDREEERRGESVDHLSGQSKGAKPLEVVLLRRRCGKRSALTAKMVCVAGWVVIGLCNDTALRRPPVAH